MSLNEAIDWRSNTYNGIEQYDAWCTVLNDRFGCWNPKPKTTDLFCAETRSRLIGKTQFVECICDPCTAVRPYKSGRLLGKETLTFQLVLSGSEQFEIGENRFCLSAGDILIWNDLNPMRFDVTEKLHKMSVTIPLTRLRSWMPRNWHSLPSYFPRGSTVSSMLSSLVFSAMPEAMGDGLRNGDAIADALLGTLVGALGNDEDQPDFCLRTSHLVRAKSYISDNLENMDLSPGDIAAVCGISLRYLHNLFQDEGMSVQQYIMLRRLEKICLDLGNKAMRHRTITDIAFFWGFQSSAHFSRRFKEEFGVSPSEYRRDLLQ